MASRRILIVTLAITMALCVNAVAASTITLDDAIALALERNADVVPALLDLELARMDLQRAEADQVLSPNPSQLRQRRLAYDKAEDNLKAQRSRVSREVSNQALAILKAHDLVALNERRLAQAKEELATVELKIRLNLESNVALLNAQKDVISAEKSLADSKASLQTARMSFLQYLGSDDINAPFDLEVRDFELTLETWDAEEALELALARTARIVSAREQLEGAQLDLKLNDAGFTPLTDRRKYEIAVEKAERVLEEEQKRAYIQVHQYRMEIASLHWELSAAELTVRVAEEQLAAAQIKLAQGMITEMQLASQENSLTQSRQALLDTKIRIRDKQQEFRDYLGS
jgi:outer membrane protein TolC